MHEGAWCSSRFEGIDDDESNTIELDEFLAVPHGVDDPKAVFAARDADDDGQLTHDEFCEGPRGWQVTDT
jgi:Ca2+-binding EF-hand superfamily protein